MSYLVDTNVLSELRRKSPHPAVTGWFENRPALTLYLSVLTIGEIRKGIEKLPASSRQLALRDWLQVDLPAFFAGRILSIDANVADRWGRLVAAAGRPIAAIDSLLAATAIEHDLTLVTRNIKDFQPLPVRIIDPWVSQATKR
jgi:predicted nucleic acid-binding protein